MIFCGKGHTIMGFTTVKRNGILIVFPSKEHSPIKIKPVTVTKPNASNKDRQIATRSANCRPCKKKKTAEQTGKRCWRCGDPVWRSDLIYCWECYKYEKYESK